MRSGRSPLHIATTGTQQNTQSFTGIYIVYTTDGELLFLGEYDEEDHGVITVMYHLAAHSLCGRRADLAVHSLTFTWKTC